MPQIDHPEALWDGTQERNSIKKVFFYPTLIKQGQLQSRRNSEMKLDRVYESHCKNGICEILRH